jgi:hypothetical protein
MVEMNTSREKVRLTTPQLAGTRPGKEKTEAFGVTIHDDLHRVQQCRDPLNLVQKDYAHRLIDSGEFCLELFRVGKIVSVGRRAGQVQSQLRFERVEQG